ncbi:hypothetical protein FQP89_19400 [Vreelandella titanicae]|uniref:Uncharacterized protein n=1 Tax=Vreelandella titanicae TaxID=664683 RepID=A0A558J2D4_9GAMM|nr:hypothetical protein FQP89_19400 [Halomonas titanicae]
MCLVARGKRSAPAGAAQSCAGVDPCRHCWLVAIGRRSAASRGCLETLAELAFLLPRATVCGATDLSVSIFLVPRGKRSAPAGAARSGAGVDSCTIQTFWMSSSTLLRSTFGLIRLFNHG